MAYTINNNFDKFKQDFKTDTKLDADKNMELYIHYVNARVNDRVMQYSHFILTEIANGLQHLPGSMRLQMAEMLKSLKKDNLI